MKFIKLADPNIGAKEAKKVALVIKSGWIGSGPKVKEFEKDFGNYKKSKNVAAVSSCTAALHLGMLACNIKPGSEVITTAMTFSATINSIIHAGLKPVLVDINLQTGNIDENKIIKSITKKTKAILPVHLAGYPCNMDQICNIAKKYKLKIIEDCAHALETEFKGTKAGNFGDIGCFSFYVTKNLTTAEGGMLISKRAKDAKRVRTLALHGLSQSAWQRFSEKGYNQKKLHYKIVEAGFKYNMTDIQAAIGLSKVPSIEKNWFIRKKLWEMYYENLSDTNIILPKYPDQSAKHGYHLFQIRVNSSRNGISRDELLQKLFLKKIGTGVHYLSIPEHPYYKKTFNWKTKNFPNAYKFGRETLSLPLSPKLTENQVRYIVKAIKSLAR